MRWLLIAIIRVYRALPAHMKRRQCIFAETCSAHVLRVVQTGGFAAGCRAFAHRWRTCRPPRGAWFDDAAEAWTVQLVDGSEVDACELAPYVVQGFEGVCGRLLRRSG
jgi:putative component of membrane protein insertase Oxa1/YidC/SpoIIIJ protein YidD